MCNNTHSPTRSNGPGANRLQAAQQEPQKTGNSTTVPLQEKEGSSFNLSNCCQAFISNSLVSETGSLVSRALSGDSPCPRLPRHLCWRDFLHLLLFLPLSFCFPKQPWLDRASQLCGHRHKAVCAPKQLCSAMDSWGSLLSVLAEVGETLFCWTTEDLVGQLIQFCHQDAICILKSQPGRSVLGFPWPGGHLERKGKHEMVR